MLTNIFLTIFEIPSVLSKSVVVW